MIKYYTLLLKSNIIISSIGGIYIGFIVTSFKTIDNRIELIRDRPLIIKNIIKYGLIGSIVGLIYPISYPLIIYYLYS